MTTATTPWTPPTAGSLLNMPLFYAVHLLKAGELAKTCPFVTKDEILLVRILDVKNHGKRAGGDYHAADVCFEYIDNATGAGRGTYTLRAIGREIKPGGPRAINQTPRVLWTMVKDSIRPTL